MGSYTFRWSHHAEEVFVTGTFDDWSKSVRLERANGGFEKYVVLPSAEHKILYKFVVDGHWTPDYGLACENDGSGNVNNVLWPDDLGRHEEPKAAASDKHMPASNSMESGQTYGVNPLPATSGYGNPVSLAAGESVPHHGNLTANTLDSNVTLDKESYEHSDRYPEEQSFGVNPLPATSGYGNPVSLAEGESVPHHSNFTANTLESNVTLDKESYERSDRYPGAESTETTSTRDAFSVPPVTNAMIPESSLPMGSDATQELEHDAHPFISSSAGTETSTASLAGQVPKEPRGVPSIVSESQHEAKYDPEASASAEAVSEKREVEEELLSRVPTAPATSEGTATTGSAATGPASQVPKVVADSQYDAGEGPEASGNPEAVAEKENVEAELKTKVPEEPATSESSTGGIAGYVAAGTAAVAAGTTAMASTASSWLPASVQQAFGTRSVEESPAKTQQSTTAESSVPSTVTESYKKAHEDPEAAANPEAVGEKSVMERELLAEVPRAEESGAGFAKTQQSTTTGSGVPSTVTESYTKAHEDPEAAANPEAVNEKSAVERELLAEVPRKEESGEPAPAEDTVLATAVPRTSKATTSTASTNAEGTLFGAGLGSVAARVFAAPTVETLAGTTSSSTPSYTDTYSSYTTTLPVQTESSTTTSLPSYPETAPFSLTNEIGSATTKDVTSYTQSSAPAVTSLESEAPPMSTATITELPVESATTTTETTSAIPAAAIAAREASASSTPAAAVGGTEAATSTSATTSGLDAPVSSTEAATTSATTSGLNAPASAPAQSVATEAKQIASGGAASSGPDKVITTPKTAEAAPTSSALPGTKSLPGSKSMSQAMKQSRAESRDLSPHSRSAAVAAASAATTSNLVATTPNKSATQTPEKAKATAPASSSATSTPASAASGGSPAAKEDKRRKRTSFFGKLKEKFGSHK